MTGFQRLEALAKTHGLVYELGGGETKPSVAARRVTKGGASRKWLVAEGDDWNAAAHALADRIEGAEA